jgi:hypothetical protein
MTNDPPPDLAIEMVPRLVKQAFAEGTSIMLRSLLPWQLTWESGY